MPFRCEDCRGPITLTTDEMIAIYEHKIALCQGCQDAMGQEAKAYEREIAAAGRQCTFDPERGAFVMTAAPTTTAGPGRVSGETDG